MARFLFIALGLVFVAAALARGDRHFIVVTSGPSSAVPPAAAGGTSLAHLDALFDARASLAATPVGFVAIGRSDPLVDPGFSRGPVPRPIGKSLPLQTALRVISPARTVVASLTGSFEDASTTVRTRGITLAAIAIPPGGPTDVISPPPPPGGPTEAISAPPLPTPAEVVSTPSLPTPAEVVSTPPLPPPAPNRLALGVPLPAPRPADVPGLTVPERAQRPADAPALTVPEPAQPVLRSRRTRMAKPPAVVVDNRSFFEKFFGGQRSSGAALAYAPSNDVPVRGRLIDPALSLPSTAVASSGTAIYDISKRTVYLPNGERLEAHSGLGDKLDDPRQVDVKMRGPTPPHVYDLTEREAPFHGVRALRLTPVGGSGAIHGREGLLAHTYMLGPRGDSNGCVSFKDYNRFLQAYLRGDVKRLVVVTGT